MFDNLQNEINTTRQIIKLSTSDILKLEAILDFFNHISLTPVQGIPLSFLLEFVPEIISYLKNIPLSELSRKQQSEIEELLVYYIESCDGADKQMAGRLLYSFKRHRYSTWLKQPKIYLFASIVAILTFISIYLIISVPEFNPAYIEVYGENLHIFNSEKELLKEIPLGYSLCKWFEDSLKNKRNYLIYDFDGDKKNEILIKTGNTKHKHKLETIFIDHNGKVKMRKDLGDSLCINRNEYDEFYRPGFLDTININNDSTMEVISIDYHWASNPCQITILDFKQGVLGKYIHDGFIYDHYILDINGDGNREIILVGTSNCKNKGILLVLDPRNTFGNSPCMHFYNDFPKGSELGYVVFPRCNDTFYKQGDRASAREVYFSKNRIEVIIDDGSGVYIYIYLNLELSFLYHKLGEDYIRIHKEIYGNEAEIKSCSLDSLIYWGGEDWTHKPTILGSKQKGKFKIKEHDQKKTGLK